MHLYRTVLIVEGGTYSYRKVFRRYDVPHIHLYIIVLSVYRYSNCCSIVPPYHVAGMLAATTSSLGLRTVSTVGSR